MKKNLIKGILSAVMFIFAANLAFADAAAELGKPAPDFTLKDISGEAIQLSSYKGNIIVLEWTNYECPFVKKFYNVGKMQSLQKTYTEKGIIWLSICSSAPGKQGYFSPDEWKKRSSEYKAASTKILLDEDGKTGKLFGAKTTPHIFIIDKEGILVYMGAIDSIPSAKSEDIAEARNYLSEALDALLSGEEVKEKSTKPYGCSVKYAD